MRILRWRIDTFGIFKNSDSGDLPPGITVFFGPNEVGKSTLCAFLRSVLFGFSSQDLYRLSAPSPGEGRYGGALVLSDGGHQYTLERFAGDTVPFRLTLPDGSQGTETDLRVLLGGIDAATFTSVFAFSSAELSSFETLRGEGVREHIFSAAVTGAGRGARTAAQKLSSVATALLKDKGAGRINRLVRELSQARTQLAEVQAEAASYSASAWESREAASRLEELSQKIAAAGEQLQILSLLLEMWPTWVELTAAERELAQLPPIEHFPPQAGERFSQLSDRLMQAQEKQEELSAEVNRLKSERARLTVNPRIVAVGEEIAALHQTLPLQREHLRRYERLKRELKELRGGKTAEQPSPPESEHCRRLPPGSFERASEKIRSIQVQRASSEPSLRAAEARAEEASKRVAALRERLARSEERLSCAAEPPPLTELTRREEVLRHLRDLRSELRTLQAERRAHEALLRDRERTIGLVAEAADCTSLDRLRRGTWVALFLFTAGGLWRLVASDTASAAFLLLLGVLAAGGIRLIFSAREKRCERLGELSELQADLREAVSHKGALSKTLSEVTQRIADHAASLGLPFSPSSEEIEALSTEIEKQKETRRQWDLLLEYCRSCREELKEAQREEKLLSQRASEAARDCRGIEDRWRQLAKELRLPEDLSPSEALEYMEKLRAIQKRENDLVQHLKAAQEERSYLAAWNERARGVLARVGEDASELNDVQLMDRIAQWYKRCYEEKQKERPAASLKEKIGEISARLGAVAKERAGVEEKLRQLFAEAGATCETDFAERRAAFLRRKELGQFIRARRQYLVARVGSGPEAESLLKELATGESMCWKQKREALLRELQELRKCREEVLHQKHEAQIALKALSLSPRLAEAQVKQEQVREELRQAARTWRVVTLAVGLIEEALREFTTAHTSGILAEASEFFRHVTRRRYTAIRQAEGREDLVLQRGDGTLQAVEQISRGTAAQLYLCLRLALAAEYARTAQSVPLVMDEVLVSFDPTRAQGMAETFGRFATAHQILLFTCRPEVRDMLRNLDPPAHVIDLEKAPRAYRS